MVDLDSVQQYEELCSRWVETLSELIQEQKSKNKEVVLVAMSRKMPRLIEVIKKKRYGHILKNLQFITEHVLPYFLVQFDSERQCIVIVDDAMYYGSTIKQITSYIHRIKSVKPYVIPVALSEMVGDLPYAEILPKKYENNVIKEEDNVIKEKNIPFFTTQNAKHIIELGRPIDMEFPILQFKVNSAKLHGEKLSEVLTKYFPDEDDYVYSINHQIKSKDEKKWSYISNYNILPKEGTPYDHWNKDFSKMRVFVSDQDVQVVAYAPGILSESVLTGDEPLFSNNRIEELWEKVRDYKMASWPEGDEEDSVTKSLRDSYRMQCVRSKTIWANYLASFLYLLKQKEAICKAISEVFEDEVLNTASFVEEDTRQLLPPQLVSEITDSLTKCFRENFAEDGGAFYGLHSEVLASQELIPEECKADYVERNRKGWQRCSMVKEALSIMFANQLFIINDGGLGNDSVRRTQRLRFGVTYTALKNNLAFPLGIDGLWKSIHKWIDKNIDEGTVKPSYERVVVDGNVYWLRMFRAGENENSFTKIRRICEFIIGKVQQKENRSYVERSVVEDLLTLVWKDPCDIIEYSYKWDSFDKKRIGSTFYLVYEEEEGKKAEKDKSKRFLDFLINQDYLQVIQDSSGISRLSTIEDVQVVTPLESAQEEAISDYVDAYYFYKKTRHQPYIMNNFFPQKDKEEFGEDYNKLVDWCRSFSDYMEKAISFGDSQKELSENFNDLDESLSHIIHQTIKVGKIANDDRENKNRIKIREYLQKEDVAEYTRFKNKLLTAVVVKELFYQLFIASNEEKASVEVLESYLSFIHDEEENKAVVRNFIHMNDDDRNQIGNKEKVIRALQNILQHQIG